MTLTTKRIETNRLVLRQFNIEDADDLYDNWASDPEVTRFLTWPTYSDRQTAVERMRYVQEIYEKGEPGDWAIELKDTRQVIGSIGIVEVHQAAKSVEIGYCIGRNWWHQGITSEAFSALIDYLFTQAGVQRVAARHDTNNPNSGAVMRKCGLTYEGTLRKSDMNNMGICDIACYSILKEEYL